MPYHNGFKPCPTSTVASSHGLQTCAPNVDSKHGIQTWTPNVLQTCVNDFVNLADELFCRKFTTLDLEQIKVQESSKDKTQGEKLKEFAPFRTFRDPSLKMKGRVFDACVRSCLPYGSEWAITTKSKSRMKEANTRMTRRMCGSRICEK